MKQKALFVILKGFLTEVNSTYFLGGESPTLKSSLNVKLEKINT